MCVCVCGGGGGGGGGGRECCNEAMKGEWGLVKKTKQYIQKINYTIIFKWKMS